MRAPRSSANQLPRLVTPRAGLVPTARPFNPDRTPALPTEHAEGCELAAYLRSRQNIRFCHVPNEGLRSPVSGARLKAAGLQAGAPDYLIFTPPPLLVRCPGAAIELKRAKYSPSDVTREQAEWLQALAALGWQCTVAGGAAEAISWLRGLGYV